jgi:hypothetical protein
LKSIIHWDDLNYYNIYVVNKINGQDGYSPGSYIAGYTQYPILGGSKTDGMVILAHEVVNSKLTIIHEMGHAFSLLHPFEGGDATTCPPNNNCNVDNDQICDTDPVQLVFDCNPSGNNPCTMGGPWTPIQHNYMTYSSCTDRFTPGQRNRMEDVINSIRTSYKNSAGVDPPSPLPTSITPPSFNNANQNNLYNMGPAYVKLNSIEMTSKGYTYEGAGYVHYVDHTCNQSTKLLKGNTYPITVKTRKPNQQDVRVYIDYNNNGTFDSLSGELVFSSNVGVSGTGTDNMYYVHSGNVSVPASGVFYDAPLRMRVMADYTGATITPTMQLTYGQAEDYTVVITQAPLPVLWRSFQARLLPNGQVSLTWVTEMELNNDYFELQKSSDGINFSTFAVVSGNREKYSASYYSYLDKDPFVGNNYYRIRQVDVDGKFSYSEVRMVNISGVPFSSYCHPNPASEQLTLSYYLPKEGIVKVSVFDLNGREVHHQVIKSAKGNHENRINIAHLNGGYYVVKVQTQDAVQIHRLLKR